MNKRKKILLTVLFGTLSLAAVSAAIFLMDDDHFLYILLFPLSGFFGYYAERSLQSRIAWGLIFPNLVLAAVLPFVFGDSLSWWFGMSPVIFYIGVFFSLLILAGWLLGLIPWKIAERIPAETKNARIERRVRLSIGLAIVLILLFGLWNTFFGNPVTAMIAGNDMRDWISAEADKGTVYEIRGNPLPRYDSWGMAYCFDLAIPAEHSRAELRWKNGEIRLMDGGW